MAERLLDEYASDKRGYVWRLYTNGHVTAGCRLFRSVKAAQRRYGRKAYLAHKLKERNYRRRTVFPRLKKFTPEYVKFYAAIAREVRGILRGFEESLADYRALPKHKR